MNECSDIQTEGATLFTAHPFCTNTDLVARLRARK